MRCCFFCCFVNFVKNDTTNKKRKERGMSVSTNGKIVASFGFLWFLSNGQQPNRGKRQPVGPSHLWMHRQEHARDLPPHGLCKYIQMMHYLNEWKKEQRPVREDNAAEQWPCSFKPTPTDLPMDPPPFCIATRCPLRYMTNIFMGHTNPKGFLINSNVGCDKISLQNILEAFEKSRAGWP